MDPKEIEAEFVELSNRWLKKEIAKQEELSLDPRETQLCTRESESVLAMLEPRCGLGTAETGPALAPPYAFTDVEPLACRRVHDHAVSKQVLASTLRAKWAEATTGPPRAMPEVLEAGDDQFRPRLLACLLYTSPSPRD